MPMAGFGYLHRAETMRQNERLQAKGRLHSVEDPVKVKGIVFDFDGPIFDGRQASRGALERTISKFGTPSVDLHVLPLLRPRQLIALVYAESAFTAQRLQEICDFYQGCLSDEEARLEIHEDIRSTIEQLASDGFRLAILTSRPEAEVRAHLSRLSLDGHFTAIVGSDTATVRKPDPEAVRQVAGRLGLAAEEVVVVGDSDSDFSAARGAGACYYHAAWPGEPCGVAATSPGVVVLRDPRDFRVLLGARDQSVRPAANVLPQELRGALDARACCFYAGAGVSVPSGIGGWDDHYLPILTDMDVRPLADSHDLPEILQLVASDKVGARKVFDRFRDSFDKPHEPNTYHYAMQRSGAQRIWTSNYDDLFEKAAAIAGFGRRVVVDDASLLQNFRDTELLIKMNGDFDHAQYADDLRWNMVLTQEQFDVADNDRREIWRLFEDDYRNTLIVFVGVSFTDPVLRRIITTVRQRIPSTRYTHLMLFREAKDPAEALRFGFHARNLERYNIRTLFFREHRDISRFVARISSYASRPIVGFSGDARLPPETTGDANTLPNGSLKVAEIETLCELIARASARKGLRITSGHGPGVGIPAVSAAFNVNPSLARFYLRKSGTSSYERTAPAIIVPGDTYEPMRERFIGELSLLVALGGVGLAKQTQPGTVAEIELAMEKRVPVLLIPQAGGHVFDYRQTFLDRIGSAYGDPKLIDAVRAANQKIWALNPGELRAFAQSDMTSLIEDMIAEAAGARVRYERAGSTW